MRARAVGHGLILAGLLFLGYVFAVAAPVNRMAGDDAFAYWSVSLPEPYAVPLGYLGSFNYAPPIALLFEPFGLAEWWVFHFLWLALLVGTIVFIGGAPLWILAILAFPPVALELYHGNVHILVALAIVLGFRHPWTWSFVLLTKVTAGVGLLWFAVRREWRSLGVALGATAVLCVATFLFMPSLWPDWLAYLDESSRVGAGSSKVDVPVWLRLPLAAAIVVWGALTDRRWTVPIAVALALPVLWFHGLAVLMAVVPELSGRSSRSPSWAARPALPWRRAGAQPA
jgi:hypothetical protein